MFVFLDFDLNKECSFVARILWTDQASTHISFTGFPQGGFFFGERPTIVGTGMIRFNIRAQS